MVNPFCFVVQVSAYLHAKCYRSDDRFLLLLPCPLSIRNLLSDVCSFRKSLLNCGDIESNPGPTDKEMLEMILSGQSNMTASINNILTNQGKIEADIAGLNEKMKLLEVQMASLNELKERICELKSTTTELEDKVTYLQDKVDELENRSRRNNLIIFGIKEESDETAESLITKVNERLFQEKLDVTVKGIERCHRLGRKSKNGRPVIIKFLDYREKGSVLKACYKLKGTEFSITEGFSFAVRNIRKKLWESSAEERSNGAKVKLFFNKLCVDGTMFAWDSANNARYKISERKK
ncbi:uncharacterized protein [Dermacentor andersoni]|uniref:uncharacterized protein n=1 Tax=Dermacentor andersoni TaxID=34620 RepID=UPI003B3B6821